MNTTGTHTSNSQSQPDVASGFGEKGRILSVAFQLALLILVIRAFRIQDHAFLQVTILTLFGFLIHAFLPMRLRLPCFALFSLVSILLVLGLSNGLWLIAIGLALIGICHLPINFSARIGLLLIAGTLLISLRLGMFAAPWSRSLWPVLGSMFMFRLIIYMYDLKHEQRSPGIARTLGYFFMAPNVCFPLFPIIDYKRFLRNYYNEDAPTIYQRGVKWIFRGVLHLLLYRYVYRYLALDPSQVDGTFAFLQYSLAAFLLYLQVSGQFHLIVGMLLLFGFNLPETHHLYYMASSFTDFWRRINIYWKDFVMKVFYYPVYFRLRKLGETKAIVLSTLIVFFATWFLHAYQWFWLRGTFLLEWHDALFWAVLAVLVVGNSLYEMRHGRDRALVHRARSLMARVAQWLSISGTFISICLLWSMWSSDSLAQWISLWKTTGWAWLGFMIFIPTLFITSRWLALISEQRKQIHESSVRAMRTPGFWRMAATSSLGIALLYTAGQPEVYSQLTPLAASVAMNIQRPTLNARDTAMLERGYYENLIAANRHSLDFWDAQQKTQQDGVVPGVKKMKALGLWHDTNDMLKGKFVPNTQLMTPRGLVAINQWGMRDKHYDKAKPLNTYRIALLGDSHAFGAGVVNNDVFESLLERRLNNASSHDSALKYEILNFGVPASFLISQLMILDDQILTFSPDTLLLMAHRRDEERTIEDLAKAVKNRLTVPYEYLRNIINRAGVNSDMALITITMRLRPYRDEILLWGYQRVVRVCRERGIRPVWLFIPMPYERLRESNVSYYLRMAQKAGFGVISMLHAYDGEEPDAVTLPTSGHPNALGHKLLADHLYEVLSGDRDIKISKPLRPKPAQGGS
jgi:D-alanyl-lipoteichoic acid acyltransferase DltB (MBOAT superfamily)